MVSGQWYNQDGLLLQYGTQKAIPEIGGDFLIYGETREIEQYIPLVPTTWGNGDVAVAAPPSTLTFVGTSTAAAAGIQSLTTMFPIQITAPQSASSSALSLTDPQLFIERVELVCLQTVAPTTNAMTVGLVYTAPGSPSSTFTQVAPNAGYQLLGTGATTGVTLGTGLSAIGGYGLFNIPSTTGAVFSGGVPIASTGQGGAWIGQAPLITSSYNPTIGGQSLPQSAWISTLTNAAFTAGLLKLRVRYNLYGTINY